MTMRIVIVDDNQMDRYIATRVLNGSGEIDVVEESISGNAFLDTYYAGEKGSVKNKPPLCVLMDINMPGLNGFETIAEMEKRYAEGRGPACVVVMMLTSSSNPEDKRAACELTSVKGYTSKPLDPGQVADIVKGYNIALASH